jgi:hypothetical protein
VLLAVDPGLRACGCAVFRDGQLVRAEHVKGSKNGERAEAWTQMFYAIWESTKSDRVEELAIEFPTTYGGKSSRGDTRDLLDLASVVGAICAGFLHAKIKVYLPAEWKGQCDTDKIILPRVLKRLSEAEQAAVIWPSAKSLRHNVTDGIGIGLVHLKRM